jgi:membrane-bound lytic murein transglycosylase D
MKSLYWPYVALTLATSSCASTNPQQDPELGLFPAADTLPDQDLKEVISAISHDIDDNTAANQVVESDLLEQNSESAPTNAAEGDQNHFTALGTEIPIELNQQVKKWIKYFTKEDPDRFARFVGRGQKFRKMIEGILAEHGVPKELYYLALIESGFATQATSHASAVGVWQFIRGTGVRYGLTVNNILDERRDPVLATHAAAQYLGDLFRVYQSWYLAMASYNAGEARIMNAIMKSNTRDFWQLVHKRALPSETMNYIPKFIAAVIIGENLEKYGFKAESTVDWRDAVEVKVPAPLRLADIARTTGISHDSLIELNPALRQKYTVTSQRDFNLRVWKSDLEKLEGSRDELAALPRSRVQHVVVAQTESNSASGKASKYYRVKRGDNLRRIAEAHGLTIRELKTLNNLKTNRIMRGQRLLVNNSTPTAKTYKVRRGDNLQKIAERFGLSVQQLKTMNRMRRNTVYPGQMLTVNQRAHSNVNSL